MTILLFRLQSKEQILQSFNIIELIEVPKVNCPKVKNRIQSGFDSFCGFI